MNVTYDSEEDYLTKEVYARYGLAMYFAQCIEHGIVNTLCYFDLLPHAKPTDTVFEFDLFMDKHFATTMGKMIRSLEATTKVSTDLSALLNQTKNNRNFLAHNYFRERALEFKTKEGCLKMIEELKLIESQFNETDKALDKLIDWGKVSPSIKK